MTGWLVQMLVWTSVLMAIVLVIRRPVARLFGPKAAYALWLAPALRAVVPPLPAASVPLPQVSAGVAGNYALTIVTAGGSGVPAGSLLLLLWIAGAIAFLAAHWFLHRQFVSRLLANGRALAVPGVACEVVASSAAAGPMATGLVHRLIVVPEDFSARFSLDEQRFALLHEALHHRRGDIWASAAALVLASVHWFNPIAYLAIGAFRRDMESACDASVIEQTGRHSARDYAQTILRCAAPPAPRSLCALTSVDELKGRLTMLNLTHGNARRIAGVALAALIAGAGLATASIAAEKTKTVERTVIVKDVNGKKTVIRGNAAAAQSMKCPGETFMVTSKGSASSHRQDNVQLKLCAGKGQSMLSTLEKAEADISRNSDMPADRKADVLAQIRAKIAQLRAKG